MNIYADKTQKGKNKAVVGAISQKQSIDKASFRFVDNRPEAIAQRRLQVLVNNNSSRAMQLKSLQEMANNSLQAKQVAQLQAMADKTTFLPMQPAQKKRHNAGVPEVLSRESVGVLQAKLIYNGALYGKGDDEKLRKDAVEVELPAWTPVQINSEEFFFKLDEAGNEWVKDAVLYFTRIDRTGKEQPAKAKTGASSSDPLKDVNFGPRHSVPNRIGPKRPERRFISNITLIKNSQLRDGHWELLCEEVVAGENGVAGHKGVVDKLKIDLTKDQYRFIYGASKDNKKKTEEIEFALKKPVLLSVLYKEAVDIANDKGAWTGTDGYNCQDFAIALLGKLDVMNEKGLEEQRKWRESIN